MSSAAAGDGDIEFREAPALSERKSSDLIGGLFEQRAIAGGDRCRGFLALRSRDDQGGRGLKVAEPLGVGTKGGVAAGANIIDDDRRRRDRGAVDGVGTLPSTLAGIRTLK